MACEAEFVDIYVHCKPEVKICLTMTFNRTREIDPFSQNNLSLAKTHPVRKIGAHEPNREREGDLQVHEGHGEAQREVLESVETEGYGGMACWR